MTTTHPLPTADTLPEGATVTLGEKCISGQCDSALAVRLGELGIRPGASVTVGTCRYAIDKRTLRAIEV